MDAASPARLSLARGSVTLTLSAKALEPGHVPTGRVSEDIMSGTQRMDAAFRVAGRRTRLARPGLGQPRRLPLWYNPDMKTCTYPECEKKHYAKNYCHGHYAQLREGRPLATLREVQGGPRVALAYRDEVGNKRCSKCREWMPETSFGKNSATPDGLTNQCRDCQWGSGLWSKYRITSERYREMLEQQGGVCAICGEGNKDGRALAVDHDHSCCPGVRSCGECVRALLCIDCNTAIGSMKDDVSLLLRAVAYLRGYDA